MDNKKSNETIHEIASNVRSLILDALHSSGSGHPGLPLGCAEFGTVLYGEIMKHCPEYPSWINRDRFVLSGGHGSILLYILLHLSGYDLSMDDIKRFRQLNSKTPGHPEYGKTPGVDTTTGPLGQGFGNAVGLALAERNLSAKFNTEEHEIINHFTYALAGDGDLMEGVSYEAASFAGHLGLGKLIVFYDSNHVTIDGKTDLTFTEDVAKRFEACNWQTLNGSAYEPDDILRLVRMAKSEQSKPTLIILESIIGKGSPDYENTHQAHGSVFSPEEIKRTKENIGRAEKPLFSVDPAVRHYFGGKQEGWLNNYQKWNLTFADWSRKYPGLRKVWEQHFSLSENSREDYKRPDYKEHEQIATRVAGGQVTGALLEAYPNLIGGSADLTKPNFAQVDQFVSISKGHYGGNYIHYGIREHAMGAISNGIALHGGLRAFCGTFLAFSDYMRPSIRLAALMNLPIIYILTHDSVLIGADGPTHQPVEFFAALEAIPGLIVFRPGDAQETVAAWEAALTRLDGPTVLALARQEAEVYAKADPDWRESLCKGAYIVRDSFSKPDIIVIATGSEVQLALQVQSELKDYHIRVVSMPSRKLFLSQDISYKENIIPPGIKRIVIEAGISMGWEGFFAEKTEILSINRFGLSGDGRQVAAALGISTEILSKKIKELL